MVAYLDDIIGITYASNPELYIICCMLICWLLYMIIQMLYVAFRIGK